MWSDEKFYHIFMHDWMYGDDIWFKINVDFKIFQLWRQPHWQEQLQEHVSVNKIFEVCKQLSICQIKIWNVNFWIKYSFLIKIKPIRLSMNFKSNPNILKNFLICKVVLIDFKCTKCTENKEYKSIPFKNEKNIYIDFSNFCCIS